MAETPTHDDAGNPVPTPSEWFKGARPLTDRVRELEAEITRLTRELQEAREALAAILRHVGTPDAEGYDRDSPRGDVYETARAALSSTDAPARPEIPQQAPAANGGAVTFGPDFD